MLYYIHVNVSMFRLSLSLQSTGWTALMFATKNGHLNVVLALISAKADILVKNKVCNYHLYRSLATSLRVVPD